MSVVDLAPFRFDGSTLVSFSGGRTSAYMLWLILQAHGGTLPPHVIVTFANTGKEREETLRFVAECGLRWGALARVNERWDQRLAPQYGQDNKNYGARVLARAAFRSCVARVGRKL